MRVYLVSFDMYARGEKWEREKFEKVERQNWDEGKDVKTQEKWEHSFTFHYLIQIRVIRVFSCLPFSFNLLTTSLISRMKIMSFHS